MSMRGIDRLLCWAVKDASSAYLEDEVVERLTDLSILTVVRIREVVGPVSKAVDGAGQSTGHWVGGWAEGWRG